MGQRQHAEEDVVVENIRGDMQIGHHKSKEKVGKLPITLGNLS
jgi:hypothetical protein